MKSMKGSLNDIVLALCIFGVLAIIIVPLPPFMLDFFIAINIAISIVLLGTSLFLNKPIDLAILPTVILASTLFRLALNIASTRLILSTGHAGAVIDTFGKIVAAGNPAVGVILFIVLTIVQFMVITKGAERIAEVSARFALDAMPGKQMAVDGELNQGLITPEVASVRRKELERESSLYGSMDGASKFVKGDAIAGIIMTIVNMIGGMGIGVLQKGYDPGYAASKYLILSIGDALGAQVPALITSVATGLIVTRSTSTGQSLSSDVISQFMQNPMALVIAGSLTASMGFLAIGSLWFFIPIGVVIVFLGLNAIRATQTASDFADQQGAAADIQAQQEQIKPPTSPDQMYGLLGVDALSLHVGANLIELADPASGGRLIEDIGLLRQHMTLIYGYILPPVRIADNRANGPYQYNIVVRGNTVSSSEVYPNRYMILKSHWDRTFDGPPPNAVNGIEPTLKEEAYWLPPDYLESLVRERQWNWPYLTAVQGITYHLMETVIANIEELFTKVDVRRVLDQVRNMDPALVDNLIPQVLSVSDLRHILINLISEKVSVKDINYILERLEDLAQKTRDPDLLSEKLRMSLARQISATNALENKTILTITLEPALEQKLEQVLYGIEDKAILVLPPDQSIALIRKILDVSRDINSQFNRRPVVLTATPSIRLPLARLIHGSDNQTAVMGYAELSNDFRPEILNTISLSDLVSNNFINQQALENTSQPDQIQRAS
jgi:flagellar biosynthesis protein FlhA